MWQLLLVPSLIDLSLEFGQYAMSLLTKHRVEKLRGMLNVLYTENLRSTGWHLFPNVEATFVILSCYPNLMTK